MFQNYSSLILDTVEVHSFFGKKDIAEVTLLTALFNFIDRINVGEQIQEG